MPLLRLFSRLFQDASNITLHLLASGTFVAPSEPVSGLTPIPWQLAEAHGDHSSAASSSKDAVVIEIAFDTHLVLTAQSFTSSHL